MAVQDKQEKRPYWRHEIRRPNYDNRGSVIGMTIAFLVAALLMYLVFSTLGPQTTEPARAPSVQTNAGPDANRVPNPNSAPKQP